MKNRKAAGLLELVLEAVMTAREARIKKINNLVNYIILKAVIPALQRSGDLNTIVSYYKVKGNPLERGNHSRLILIDHTLKILQRIIKSLIKKQAEISEIQFGFIPGSENTKTIFIETDTEEKVSGKEKLVS